MAGDTMRRLAAACWLERARERPGQLAAGPASQQRAPQASSMRTNYKNPHPALWARLLVILFLATHSSQPNSNKQVRALETSASDGAAARLADQLVGRLPSADAISQAGAQFDGAKFSSLHEALRAHPDLSQVSHESPLTWPTAICRRPGGKTNERRPLRGGSAWRTGQTVGKFTWPIDRRASDVALMAGQEAAVAAAAATDAATDAATMGRDMSKVADVEKPHELSGRQLGGKNALRDSI